MNDDYTLFLKKKKNYKRLVFGIQLTIIVLFIAIWELAARLDLINDFIFSSPFKIINTTTEYFLKHNLLFHIITTLKEISIAFSLGIIFGFIIALLMYTNKLLANIIDPFLTVINSLPKVALGPIIIIWCGANTKSIIVMALLINLIVSILNIYNGFSNTDKIKIKLLKSFGASKYQIITNLVIPASYTNIISSLKINISMTLIGLCEVCRESIYI